MKCYHLCGPNQTQEHSVLWEARDHNRQTAMPQSFQPLWIGVEQTYASFLRLQKPRKENFRRKGMHYSLKYYQEDTHKNGLLDFQIPKSLLDDHVIYFQTGTLFRLKQNAIHHYTETRGVPWPCPWCSWIYGHLSLSWSLPVQDPGDG